ncbi:MAG TPA: hypothetical protein VF510_17650 [Ktedonobacterales bacterium]
MSWVTNTILVFGDGQQEPLDKVNAFFREGPGHGPGFVSVEDTSLPQHWYGGGKNLECSLALGAFNNLDIKALVDHLCALCLAGALDDERTQLLLRDQEEDKFHVINIDEEMRARGMRMPWWGPDEANDL